MKVLNENGEPMRRTIGFKKEWVADAGEISVGGGGKIEPERRFIWHGHDGNDRMEPYANKEKKR